MPASEGKLEEVTTPSLPALRLFSEADVLLHDRMHGAAAELLEGALSEDPDFAAAHMWLAWALRNEGLPEDEWLPYVEESVRLSSGVSEPERLVILAKAHSIRGEHEKAVPLYEALLRLDPDHYWATNNLMASYAALGRYEDLLRIRTRYVRLRPNDPGAHFVLARELAYQQFDFEQARQYQERALKLVRAGGNIDSDEDWLAWVVARAEMFPALRMLAEGQPEPARLAAGALESQLSSLREPLHSQLLIQLGYFYGTLGRLSKARELFAKLSDPMERFGLELEAALWRDDRKEMERAAMRLYESGDRLAPAVAIVLARTGHWSEAEKTLQSYEERPNLGHLALWLEGEIAAARRDYGKAEESLHSALEWMKPRNSSALYPTAETLARVYQEQGKVFEAIRALGEVSDLRRLINPWCGPYWLKTRLQLLDLYDTPEFEEQKTELEARLRKFLGREIASLRSGNRSDHRPN